MKKKTIAMAVAVIMIMALAMPLMALANDPTIDLTVKFTTPAGAPGTDSSRTFYAYKLFGVKTSVTFDNTVDPPAEIISYEYTLNPEFAEFAPSGFTPVSTASSLYEYLLSIQAIESTGPNGPASANIMMQELTRELTNWIREREEAAEEASLAPPFEEVRSKTADEGDTEVVIEGLDPGYYLVIGATGTRAITDRAVAAFALMTLDLDSTEPGEHEINLVDKVDVDLPVLEKRDDAANESIYGDKTGEYINYMLTVEVPDITGFDPAQYQYVITDKMTGLTFDTTSSQFVVRIVEIDEDAEGNEVRAYDRALITNDGVADPDDYEYTMVPTTTAGRADGFILTFMQPFFEAVDLPAGTSIEINYRAHLNKDAVSTSAEEVENAANPGGENIVTLRYSNDPMDHTKTGLLTDEEKVATFNIDLFKFQGNNIGLAEVKFELQNARGEAIELFQIHVGSATAHSIYRIAERHEIADPEIDTTFEILTPVSGRVQIRGVGAGTYFLEEKSAPGNFNELDDPVRIVIGATGLQEWEIEGKEFEYGINAGGTIIAIENRRNSPFPETGGMGRTILYITGFIMIAAAGTALFVRRSAKSAAAKVEGSR